MSNSKILKTVDWYIEIPEETEAKFKKKKISSSIFGVEFMNVKTLWNLDYNLNDGNNEEFAVFLQMCSDPEEIGFICKLEASIVGSPFSLSFVVCKHEWGDDDAYGSDKKKNESPKSTNWGGTISKSEILREKRNELCINGKVHLRFNLSAIDLTEEQLLELQKHEKPLNGTNDDLKIVFTPNFSKSDSIFDVIKSYDSDVLINTDDGMVLKAHKSVLSMKSTVLQNMFTIDMEETASKSVDIIEFKGQVMEELLRFIYFGNVHNIEQVDVELFKAAKVYEIAELPEICLKSITASVNHENVIDIVQLADVHGLDELFQLCCGKIRQLRHQQFIQKSLDDLEMKLQIKILNKIITQMEKLEIHVEVETCAFE